MKRLFAIPALLLAGALAVAGCATHQEGWVILIDGDKGLENFNRLGDANWRAEGGAIVADKGKGGHLITKSPYKDFELRAEFWAEATTNSGIFIRASDPKNITATNAYEVNIFDGRPDPSYGTGAIVNFAVVNPMPKAAGRWNTYEIYAKGPEVTVKLNGVVTVSMRDSSFASGPFTLQYGGGPKGVPGGAIKWRHVSVKPL